jgi:hypothetical protein
VAPTVESLLVAISVVHARSGSNDSISPASKARRETHLPRQSRKSTGTFAPTTFEEQETDETDIWILHHDLEGKWIVIAVTRVSFVYISQCPSLLPSHLRCVYPTIPQLPRSMAPSLPTNFSTNSFYFGFLPIHGSQWRMTWFNSICSLDQQNYWESNHEIWTLGHDPGPATAESREPLQSRGITSLADAKRNERFREHTLKHSIVLVWVISNQIHSDRLKWFPLY